ncbi:magnesium transporter [bacterium]|nr:magnesium transporter [bacterium]MBU1993916.1 magnesium transporter [bacterium]
MEEQNSNIEELILKVQEYIFAYNELGEKEAHPQDTAEILEDIYALDHERFSKIVASIPHEYLANIILELPEKLKEELYNFFSPEELAQITTHLYTDDATDMILDIQEMNEKMASAVLENMGAEDREQIELLSSFDENEAGSYMQTELFTALKDESIGSAMKRLKQMKRAGEIENVHQLYIIDKRKHFIASILLEDLIMYSRDDSFATLDEEELHHLSVNAHDDIHDVVNLFEKYDVAVLPVLDKNNKLIGRITSDDIYDVIEKHATEQIFNLAGVNESIESEEKFFQVGKHRAIWLGVNLLTAIAASFVIGIFDQALQSMVALAILMPIVASMGGNAGTQSLAVTVRQLAIGDIDFEDAKATIIKETLLALFSGVIFAFVMGIIAYFWFNLPMLGLVIGLSMVINLFAAGFFGAVIPMVLTKVGSDPAIGSSVVLTTVTDIVGFFSFLGLASLILL